MQPKNEPVPKHYAFGGFAACLLVASTFGMIFQFQSGKMQLQNEKMQQSTAIPLEILDSGQITSSAVTTSAVTTSGSDRTTQTVTSTAVATSDIPVLTEWAEYETVLPVTEETLLPQPLATEISVEITSITDMQTTSVTETTVATTQTTGIPVSVPVYELGDVDMDGQITYVDAALVTIDYCFAAKFIGLWEASPLTPEQVQLGNVNGLNDCEYCTDYPLSQADAAIIYHVAQYRKWYNMDITVEEYCQNPEYYDALADFDAYKSKYGETWSKSLEDSVKTYNEIHCAGFSRCFNKDFHGEFRLTPEAFYEKAEETRRMFRGTSVCEDN